MGKVEKGEGKKENGFILSRKNGGRKKNRLPEDTRPPSLIFSEQAVVKRLLQPLSPIPTGYPVNGFPVQPRAVIFDIYGTLLISAAGDVGPDSAEDDEQAFLQALADGGWDPALVRGSGTGLLQEEIAACQQDKRTKGIAFPEIDILQIWQRVLIRLGLITEGENRIKLKKIRLTALSYECRTNPVWPMPGLLETLRGLQARNIMLGILSNAQFYTPILFELLCDHQSLTGLGFSPELCLFSYQEGEGKPSPNLFSTLASRLDDYGVAASEVLYVGNDMLKDIRPAAKIGWQTALFAGDNRSLRLHQNDPDVEAVRPTLVIDDLRLLLEATLSRS